MNLTTPAAASTGLFWPNPDLFDKDLRLDTESDAIWADVPQKPRTPFPITACRGSNASGMAGLIRDRHNKRSAGETIHHANH
jgi:hypothetical protein